MPGCCDREKAATEASIPEGRRAILIREDEAESGSLPEEARRQAHGALAEAGLLDDVRLWQMPGVVYNTGVLMAAERHEADMLAFPCLTVRLSAVGG